MNIALITPAPTGSRGGNRATAERWSLFLRELGHNVEIDESWRGEPCDLMISLHARRSHDSIRRFASAHPRLPLVVVLTGTDLYRDILTDQAARKSLDLATHLVVLQEAGLSELAPRHRAKSRVIFQSAGQVSREPSDERYFDVLVAGHLRPEKDSFRAALAAALLPATSRIRILHAGKALEREFEERARELMKTSPRYRWLEEVSREQVKRLMARSRLMVQSSLMEGGANTISEALAAGLPVIASDIPGNVGMLGEDYPGYYPVGDEHALAKLLSRAETEAEFHESLALHCEARRHLTLPERERDALGALIREAVGHRRAISEYNGGMDKRTRIRLTKYSTKAG